MKPIKRLHRPTPPSDPARLSATVRAIDRVHLINIALEVWRLDNRYKGSQLQTGKDDPSFRFSIEKIYHSLKVIGIEVKDPCGETYCEGLSMDVLTFDYPNGQHPEHRVVQETVSPAIYFSGHLVKLAQVIVGTEGDK